MEQKVNLFLRARSLPQLDNWSQSDPFVVIFGKVPGKKDLVEIHRTEVLSNQKHPQWPEPVHLIYKFNKKQPLRFEVYDSDGKSDDLSKQDFIGEVDTTLSTILTARKKLFKAPLVDENGKKVDEAKFFIVGEVVENTQDVLSFKFSSRKLDKRNAMGFRKSDPFYRISLSMKTNIPPVVVFESEHINKTSDPKWRRQEVPLKLFCNGDLKRDVKIEVYDWEKNGRHKFIGMFIASTEELLEKPQFNLVNLKTKKKSAGTFIIERMQINKKPSFLQYIEGGCQINLSIGIDFSTKNKDLHEIKDNELNQYQQAIVTIGQILEEYDSDKKIGAFGFGGALDSNLDDDCFPISLNENIIELDGVNDILETYIKNIEDIRPSEVCNMSKVIHKISNEIKQVSQDNQSYNVLLLLTSGNLNDFDDTVRQIVKASSKPLSIIIVGLGKSKFTQMDILDGDSSIHLTDNEDNSAVRDIVQFVPYLKTIKKNKDKLAEITLNELPEQLERFMWSKNITPNQV